MYLDTRRSSIPSRTSLSFRYVQLAVLDQKRGCGVYANRTTQRNLNNAFAYDLVPSPSVLVAALKAARRVNDYPTAVRVFEGKHPLPKAEMLAGSHMCVDKR